jgi:tetratricopeptide (TPR) repeat protein
MIAECYLRKNYYNDALTIYKQLAEIDFDSDILFQKVGYCKQMEGDIEGALKDYLHADLINPDSKWVIKHIAACYRSLKKPQEALTYYRRYEALNPDNLSIQISIGNCLLELKDYNEAIKCFFKVDYLDHKSHKAWRPIAWCSFLTGKYDQAKNYYKKILDNKPNAQDLLNAGHTEWALQNIKGALSYYQQVVQKEDGDFNKFQDLFNQDIPDLLVAGIETPEITLMLEQLRYKISGDL